MTPTDKPIEPPTQRDARLTLHNRSQRRINLLWESTQAGIAIAVVLANIAVVFVATTNANGAAKEAMMANAFFLIVGFYFGRTNHTKTGGIGRGIHHIDEHQQEA
jgi:hypothetical protein